MKTILIDVPEAGTSVHFVLKKGAGSGQVAVVVTDDVEIRDHNSQQTNSTDAKPVLPTNRGKATSNKSGSFDLELIFKRLLKLKPTKRASAINSIKAMFQFDAPITDQTAEKILESLRKNGGLSIDSHGRIQFRNR